MRQRSTSLHWSPQYQQIFEGCRLLGVRAVLGHTSCKELVTALIKRWWPETNTFHLVLGEATITLEDKEVLTGLPTTGRPLIVSPDERPVTEICEQWLGAGVLLADRNGDHIHVHLLQLIGDPRVASTYNWGSAVLAWLYKVMGRAAFFSAGSMRGTGDIGGFTLLVELWALERFPRIAERYIHGGAPPPPPPPADDTVLRGAGWLPVIERHQHRVAMHLEDIRYALDLCTDFVVRFPTLSPSI
ncbi:Serine/threonine-protein phosphatase 7 long form homolog [Linum perenne]